MASRAIIIRPVFAKENQLPKFDVRFQGFAPDKEVKVDVLCGNEQFGSVSGKVVKSADSSEWTLQRSGAKDDKETTATFSSVTFVFGGDFSASFVPTSRRADNFHGEWWPFQLRASPGVGGEPFDPVLSPIFPVARLPSTLINGDSGLAKATYNWYTGNAVTFYADASEDEEGTAGAFADIDAAIAEAENFIFIADWSFHPYTRLKHSPMPRKLDKDKESDISKRVEETIGAKLAKKAAAKPNMVIAIHTWAHIEAEPPNDGAEKALNDIAKAVTGKDRTKNFMWRSSSRTGVGWSHHQKYVILDCPGEGNRRDIKVFFGGLDLTKGRFDWGSHFIMPTADEARYFLDTIPGKLYAKMSSEVDYDDWYNAEFKDDRNAPRQPWHDIHAQLKGPAGWDFVREFVGRWNLDPAMKPFGANGDSGEAAIKLVDDKFLELFKRDKFIQQWEERESGWGSGAQWVAQVHRSIIKEHWGSKKALMNPDWSKSREELTWTLPGTSFEKSIQDAYVNAINKAEKFIYIETQYLIGSGSKWSRNSVANTIPEAIVNRILKVSDGGKNENFHVYMVLPMFPEGDPVSTGLLAVRQLQWNTITWMVRALYEKLGESWRDYLSFYFLARWQKSRWPGEFPTSVQMDGIRKERVVANRRYMIYVHSKMMIVDDKYIILGSANLNERSLAGDRDTEICVGFSPAKGNEKACYDQLKAFRHKLWTEHLGPLVPVKWEDAGLRPTSKVVRAAGNTYYRMLRTLSDSGKAACGWPLIWMKDDPKWPLIFNVNRAANIKTEIDDHVIPDGTSEGSNPQHDGFFTSSDDYWIWTSPGWHIAAGSAITAAE